MSRRARRNKQQGSHAKRISTTTILTIGALLIGAFFVNQLWNTSKQNTYPDLPSLPIEDYIENGLSLRNNQYQLQGEVVEKPESDLTQGQLVFVRVKVEETQEVEEVSIKVPSHVGKVNLETKHDYTFKVKVIEGGFLIAQDYQPL